MIISLNIPEHRRGGYWVRESEILMRINLPMSEFYTWLGASRERLNKLCDRYGWSYDIGYSDQIVKITKTKTKISLSELPYN